MAILACKPTGERVNNISQFVKQCPSYLSNHCHDDLNLNLEREHHGVYFSWVSSWSSPLNVVPVLLFASKRTNNQRNFYMSRWDGGHKWPWTYTAWDQPNTQLWFHSRVLLCLNWVMAWMATCTPRCPLSRPKPATEVHENVFDLLCKHIFSGLEFYNRAFTSLRTHLCARYL